MLARRTRRGLGLLAFGAIGAMAALAACSAEGLNASGGGFTDGGLSEVGANGGDATTDSSAADALVPDAGAGLPATVLFVQASPSLPDVRLCWGSTTGGVTTAVPFPGTGAMPGSNYPGIPLGGGAALSDVGDLASSGVTLYAIDAENLARLEQGQPQYTCKDLICSQGTNPPPPCLRPNADYWPLAPLTSGLQGGTTVLALTGCLGTALDPLATTGRCGTGWSAVTGNLHADVLHLTSSAPSDAGQLVAQAALLSPALAELLQVPEAGTDAGDAGDDGGGVPVAIVSFGAADGGGTVLATLSAEGDVEPLSPATVQLGGSLSAFGSLGFSVDVPSIAGGAGHEWMSLVQAQQLVDPTEDPTVFFGQPRTYLVAVVGDPGAPHAFTATGDGGYDGTGLHLLVLASPAPPPPAGDP